MSSQQTLERVLFQIVRWTLYLVPFIVLVVSFNFFFPFIVAKNFTFRILIELALIPYLGLLFIDKKYWPKWNLMTVAMTVFLAVILLADIFGINFFKSFWSNYERMEGFITFVHLGLYFLMLGSIFRSKEDWVWYWNVVLGVGVIEGIYGFLQIPGINVLKNFQGAFRVEGTMGNSAYMAAFMSFLIFIGAWLSLNARNKYWKYAYWIVAAWLFTITLFTATRGAYLAFIVTGTLALLGALILSKKKVIVGSLLAVLVLGVLGLYLAKDIPAVKNNPTFSRFANISLSEGTIQSRFMIWHMAFEGFKERPFLGWGQESFMYAFGKYYNPNLYGQEPWFDRAHDIVFDWLIIGGILGFLAYISLFVISFYILIRGFLRKKNLDSSDGASNKLKEKAPLLSRFSKPELFIFLLLVISYLIQNIFVFDSTNTYILIFAFFAFVMSLARNDFVKNQPLTDGVFRGITVSSVALVVLALSVYALHIQPIMQNFALTAAISNTNVKSFDDFMNNWKVATSYNSFGLTEVRERMSEAMYGILSLQNLPNEQKLTFARFTLDELKKEVASDPKNLREHLFLLGVYSRILPYDNSYAQAALQEIDASLAISSTKQDVYFTAAEVYNQLGDFEKSRDLLQKAVDLAPQFERPKANLAVITVLSKKTDIDKKDNAGAAAKDAEVEKIIASIPNPAAGILHPAADTYGRVGSAYNSIGDPFHAMIYLNKALELEPKNSNYLAVLVDINARAGNFDEAIRLANELKAADPSYADRVDALIKQMSDLKKGKK